MSVAPRDWKRYLAVPAHAACWFWKGAQLVFGVALGLIVVEGLLHAFPGLLPLGFRVFNDFKQPYTQYDEDFVVRGIPNLRLTIDTHPEYVMHVALNDKGYRDPLTAGPVHALVMGDSFIFGTGVEHEQTFCEQLKKRSGAPFVNMAIGSYGPAHFVQVLRRDGQMFDPKVVLLMLYVNDVEDCGRFKEWRDRPYPRVPKPVTAAVTTPSAPPRGWRTRALEAGRESLSWRLIQWNFNPTAPQKNFRAPLRHRDGALDLEFNESILSWADPEEGATEQNWTLFGAALAAIHDWSVERGVPVVAVIVPSKEEVYRAARLRTGGHHRFDEMFEKMRGRMGRLCQEQGVAFHDLTEPMRHACRTHPRPSVLLLGRPLERPRARGRRRVNAGLPREPWPGAMKVFYASEHATQSRDAFYYWAEGVWRSIA